MRAYLIVPLFNPSRSDQILDIKVDSRQVAREIRLSKMKINLSQPGAAVARRTCLIKSWAPYLHVLSSRGQRLEQAPYWPPGQDLGRPVHAHFQGVTALANRSLCWADAVLHQFPTLQALHTNDNSGKGPQDAEESRP